MIRVLVSSCLLGERVRYHGGDARSDEEILRAWLAEDRLVPFCPEVEAGLGVPRPPAEIVGGDGSEVLEGRARVVSAAGEDLSEVFVQGAEATLARARASAVGLAVLTDRSPSCGSRSIYDGTFSGRLRPGRGVTTALLERHGMRVFPPDEVGAARTCLARLERRV